MEAEAGLDGAAGSKMEPPELVTGFQAIPVSDHALLDFDAIFYVALC